MRDLATGKVTRQEYFVYVIFVKAQTSTVIKIGRGASVRERISGVRIGCPFPVSRVFSWDVHTVENGTAVEKEAHDLYSHCRLNGEWFDPWGGNPNDDEVESVMRNINDIILEETGIGDPRVTEHRPREWYGRMVRMEPFVVNEGSAIPPQVAKVFSVGAVEKMPPVTKKRRLWRRC